MARWPWQKPAQAIEVSRSYSLESYIHDLTSFTFDGHRYTLPGSKQDAIGGEFQSLVTYAYKQNGIVFACCLVRQLVFSEARFQFRQIRSGRPGKLFGSEALRPLEEPWPGGTTGDLLSRMEQDASFAGNSFTTRRAGGTLRRLRPDWVDMILGSESDDEIGAWDVDADVLGYVYWPGGRNSGRDFETFLAEEVAHYAPIPDPEAQFRGMSWLTPIIREVMADKATTDHKLSFLENGATPNLVVKLDTQNLEMFEKWIEKFKATHEGAANAYKTMFLGAGADVTPVGTNLAELDFKSVQGAGETRIAAAAGTPPVIVGLSEGLQGSSLNAGNYQAARRRFADATMRPLWRNAAGSLARIIDVPANSELWYDDRDISFLQEDVLDAAEIQGKEAVTLRQLLDGGFTPDSAIASVIAGDWSLLEHTGLFSVQLQPPTPEAPAAPVAPVLMSANGNGRSHERSHERDGELLRALAGLAERPVQVVMPEQPAPEVRFEEGAIMVAPPAVTFEEGAFRAGDVTVEASAPPEVRFEEGAFQMAPPAVNFQEGAFRAGDVTVEAPSPPNVEAHFHAAPGGRVRRTLERDADGTVVGSVEEPVEEST